MYPEKSMTWKETCNPVFTAALLTKWVSTYGVYCWRAYYVSGTWTRSYSFQTRLGHPGWHGRRRATKTWKQPKCPSTEEQIKMWGIHTMDYYSALQRINDAICSDTDGSRGCRTEWSKSDRGEMSCDIPDVWSLETNDANELTKQKETHRLRKRTCGFQEEGIVRECGRDTYTLLYLKWITNKVHSTWNSAKCWGRMMHVYVWLSSFTVHVKPSQYY